MSHDPQQPADPSRFAREPYLLKPITSRHQQESRRLIARAAEAVAPGRAIVLGAGACEEIPLAQLVARFGQVTLNDVEPGPLQRAVTAANLAPPDREKIEMHVADLTGTTGPLLEKIASALETSADVGSAIDRMAEMVAGQEVGGLLLAGKYDLVVASCVLSQLHFGLTHRAGDLLANRFPGAIEQLRAIGGFLLRITRGVPFFWAPGPEPAPPVWASPPGCRGGRARAPDPGGCLPVVGGAAGGREGGPPRVGVDRQVHDHRPPPVGVAVDDPVRHDGDRLVDQLEPAFRLADAFDREGPQARRPRKRQVHVDAQPLVDQAQLAGVGQVEPRAELAEAAARRRRSSGRRPRRAVRRS